MSKIIKSIAVVDKRPDADLRFFVQAHEPDTALPVIKRQALGGQAQMVYRPPARDALLEELNGIRVEIEDAQNELRAMNRQVKDTYAQIEALEEQRKALEALEGLSIDEQARAIIQDAEQQAKQIVEWAQNQASEAVDQLKTQGYLDGLEQGASEAHERYSAEHEPDIHKLEALITELSGMKQEIIRESESDIVSLIITVAEKVIGRAVKDDPKTVVDMLREVMEQNHREQYVKVTISEDLIPATAKVTENICKTIQQLGQEVDVVVSTSDPPGTLVVETVGGITDLSVQTQLDSIQETLREDTSPAL